MFSSMDRKNKWPGALASIGCIAVCMGMLTACGEDNEGKIRFSKPEPIEETTATISSASENQTDYIMERYLAPEERLRRRQARITAVLADAGTTAAPDATR